MLHALQNKEKKIAVLGLGYVGLPLALEFACDFSVIGFDINDARVEMMKNHQDPSRELPSSAFENREITFTSNIEDLREAHFYIVAVPTPIDRHKVPNLGPVFSASTLVGKVIKPGDYVVFESTVYPGCTEEDCLPLVEKESGLKAGVDLGQALELALKDLDGFYTFVVGTEKGFGVLRDPIACKPAVLAETDQYVAFGSEYRALASLPYIEKAKVWEPEPATVYFWEHNK